ncbi:hypothetical protein [Roseisolibacter sp. H3M3-2]|uniref:hypothetical protein n=1 Tax=Roseisolibacter sp. H3M3-2 TaxID=3031323 RepID=UPI0023DBB5AF|nr:hypothetical protein [Roseisolibacter sp. H3M3-2]MDF1505103.1 hypothetical protein [Roseisolibacter sp. H3M3-2]
MPAPRAATALALAALLSATACAHGRGGARRPGFEISSLESVYTPAGRFTGAWRVTREAVEILVDSARITAPWPGGTAGAEPMAVREDGRLVDTRPLVAVGTRVTALLVTGAALTPGQPRPWTAHAESEALAVADTLRVGDVRTLTGLRFRLPRPAGLALDSAWIVFRLDSGPSRSGGAAQQTFACSPRNLAGADDAAGPRAEVLAENYTLAC